MYIIVGEDLKKQVDSKYLVFELDTIRYTESADPVTAYCVVDSEHVPLNNLTEMDQWTELHDNLMKNYRKRNWNYCIQAIEHLRGNFKGELDTFYDDLEKRCEVFEQFPPGPDWDGVVTKTHQDAGVDSV